MSSDVAELVREAEALPDGWQQATLGDIIALEYGRSLPDQARRSGKVPVYGSNGIVGWHDEALVPTGGIIVGRKGTAGSVTVSSDPFWPIDTTYFVKPRQTVDWDWLAASLHHARLNALNEATGVPGLNRDKAYLQPILLPPLDEQRRIAEVLRSVDEAIAAAQRTVEATVTVRQVVLDAMIQRVLDDPDTNVRPLSDIAEVRTGLAKNKNRSGPKVRVPYVRVANVQDGWFDLADMQEIEVDPGQVERYLLQPGDVLLTEGGDYDKLGRGGVWRGEVAPCLHQNHVFCVRPDTNALLADYFALATQSAWGRAYFLSCAKRTTNLASINSSQLRAFPVPVVSTATQAGLIEEVAGIDAMIDLDKRQLETLLRLRGEVSSDLLSGRVRVPT
jgi:type I restriction enzyme S subunit